MTHNILSDEFLKEIFEVQDDLLKSAVLDPALKILKNKVYEWFKTDIFELLENRSCRYLLNAEQKNIYNMPEESVRELFNNCLYHSIASFTTRHLHDGEPLILKE